MSLKEAINKILDEGTEQLKADGEQVHVKALGDALFRAATEPECEVRLTYKTMAMAAAAWTWMIWAAEKMKMRDKERSLAFDVELINGSGIIFWTDEGVPEVAVASG
jgi:hypothetical protein